MLANGKLKRFLCLALTCLMLTPIVSFATTDSSDDTTTTADTTDTTVEDTNESATGKESFVYNLNSTADKTGADLDKVDSIKELLASSSTTRKEAAIEAAIVSASKEDIQGHSYVCSAGIYELYLNQETLSVIIRDSESGAIITSTLSKEDALARGYTQTMYDIVTTGLYIDPIVYDPEAQSQFGDYQPGTLTSVRNATLDYTMKDDGFDVHILFDSLGIELTLKVTLDESGLKCEIPIDSVKENNEMYLLGNLYLFSLLGNTDRGDRDGYMIIPDGNGIIVDYQDFFVDGTPKYKSSFSKRVYGGDLGIDNAGVTPTSIEGTGGSSNPAEDIIAPYFGMVHTDSQIAVLGIIVNGEESSYIDSSLNGVSNCFENYIGARFAYRENYNEYIDTSINNTTQMASDIFLLGNVEVEYLFTSGEEATYSGLANSLRNYLIETGVLTKTDNQDFNVRIDFMGADKEDFLVFKRNVIATTAEQISEIINKLEDLGVTDITAIYEGWQEDGVYNVPFDSFDADSDIGGNSGIIDLYEELKDKSIDLYLMTDMLSINTSLSSSTFTSVNMFNKKTYEDFNRYAEVFDTFRALFPAKSEEYIKNLADDCLGEGIKNLALSGISNNLFAYLEDSKQYSRSNSMQHYEDALKEVKDNGTDVILEAPFMYLWKYTDAYLNMPIGSSMYVYATQEIPFLTSVLKGSMNIYSEYINFEANATEYFLKLVETGIYPSFILTYESPETLQYTNSNWIYTSEYEKYEDLIVEYNEKLGALNEMTKDAYIVGHERLDSNVGITTYSNGVKVYINFSEAEVTVDDMTIEALSYKVGETE